MSTWACVPSNYLSVPSFSRCRPGESAYRDHIAYARVVSGTFECEDVLNHAATGKPFVTKYAQSVFGQQRARWTRRGRVM